MKTSLHIHATLDDRNAQTAGWHALRLEAAPGQRITLPLNPGAAFTCLSDLILGLLAPAQGHVRVLGHEWQNVTKPATCALRGRIGVLHNQPVWISNLSVYENLTLSMRHHTTTPEATIRNAYESLAATWPGGNPPPADVRPRALTERQAKRFAILRTFLGNPELILLDHPTVNREDDDTGWVRNLIDRAAARGAAILLSCNDIQLREALVPAVTRTEYQIDAEAQLRRKE